jgi:hypothetical protein
MFMRYELWKYEDDYGVGWTFMPVDNQYEAFLKYKRKFEPNSEMVWSVEAETKDEAIARYHEFMGRENGKLIDDIGFTYNCLQTIERDLI